MLHRKFKFKKRLSNSFTMGKRDQHTKQHLSIQQTTNTQNTRILFFGYIRKCFDATTLHGFKYLSEPNRPLYERIFWLTAILLVYFTVAFIIIDQVNNFQKSPVLITFDSKSRSVEEIPFPAVTICSDNQIRSSMINLTKAFEDVQHLSPEMRKRFEYAVYICNFYYPVDQFETFEPEFVYEMLEAVFGNDTCSDQIPKLEWFSHSLVTPCNYFQPMVTIQGACLSFNMLPFTYIFRNPSAIFRNWAEQNWKDKMNVWSPDTGFVSGGGVYPGQPPWKTFGNNIAYFGLNIKMEESEELCSRGGKGFTVYVHNPAEMPGPSHALLYLEENRDTTVSVIPQFYITDESLKKWPTRDRGCYFQNERFLKYFQIYTQHNCELECRANVTLRHCHCTPHHFPRSLNTPVCGPARRHCIDTSIVNSSEALSCDCLPSCSELQYRINVNKAPRNLSQDLVYQSNNTYTILKIMFQTHYFIGIKRTVMFGLSDFIANIGGLLGLFLGFSILSLVEIIYFIFIRPYTNYTYNVKRIKPVNFNVITGNYGSLPLLNGFHRGLFNYPITYRNVRY